MSSCGRSKTNWLVAARDAVGTADQRRIERCKVGEVRKRSVCWEDVSFTEPETPREILESSPGFKRFFALCEDCVIWP